MSMQRKNSYLVQQNKNHIIKLCYHAYYRMKEGFDIINHTLWCMAKTGVIYCTVLRQFFN